MAGWWDAPVTVLKSVGDRRAEQFARLHIRTVGDLLRHYPRHYEDWSHPVSIASAPFGEPLLCTGHCSDSAGGAAGAPRDGAVPFFCR